FHDTHIGPGARLHRVIIDKNVRIEKEAQLGIELGDGAANRTYATHLNSGLSVLGKGVRVPPGMRIGRNCCIGPGVDLGAAGARELGDGETVEDRPD
ncbi:MAG: glucose-1-phosphate adenylyltransferase, partial [Candidatus Eisenbacteria bacterium]|nr:glucose-1-phosphate adenylyltransferase [Candidatus Eisenbacteria bacterium]